MTADYQSYIDRLTELHRQEEAQLQSVSQLKKGGLFKRKQAKLLEDAEEALRSIRTESEKLCKMLDAMREKENVRAVKQTQLWDEEPQEYNEVIGICYRKVILVTDSGRLLWFDCNEADGTVAIGDSELDDGLLCPMSALPAGERKMILSYLIEAGSTPVHYLNLLKEELA